MSLLTGYVPADWLCHCWLVISLLTGYITADWLYHCWLVFMSLLTTQQPPTHLPLWWCWRPPWSRASWGQPESWRRAWRTGRPSASPRSARPCTARPRQMQPVLLQKNTPSVTMHCTATSDATRSPATKHTKCDHATRSSTAKHTKCDHAWPRHTKTSEPHRLQLFLPCYSSGCSCVPLLRGRRSCVVLY